uniref:14-3-3 domain-containing protein n=1 Tax=Chromera velia CCMP2878 TaxID=1169474 RepID=A0A0G4H3P5_9ALVE|mmetsp:Transcript_49536/g.97524  ORF Transcript_49536/g.97524 Transcript_49536/m.97524 type:complete len:281 (+) Transcript_49536:169-1011(+)|eukprot:Cvel_5624.t1-p1 / transcript=Cvel_5624.t1 / gene=Cvel_5624 / organism=Chromera_velia_CCMP2878 / gene_product=hypothetical protein / transcript_product=hypothetical protein / location=Cvel_scaffold265:4640-9528(-) / protein_length=280 / sequence_SO=supercontig / SO=protein_coding / is_pseudo=false
MRLFVASALFAGLFVAQADQEFLVTLERATAENAAAELATKTTLAKSAYKTADFVQFTKAQVEGLGGARGSPELLKDVYNAYVGAIGENRDALFVIRKQLPELSKTEDGKKAAEEYLKKVETETTTLCDEAIALLAAFNGLEETGPKLTALRLNADLLRYKLEVVKESGDDAAKGQLAAEAKQAYEALESATSQLEGDALVTSEVVGAMNNQLLFEFQQAKEAGTPEAMTPVCEKAKGSKTKIEEVYKKKQFDKDAAETLHAADPNIAKLSTNIEIFCVA